jgi:hypothetical protein
VAAKIFLSLSKFDVASGERSVVSLDASIERIIGQLNAFGGAFTIMSRPFQRVPHGVAQILLLSQTQKNLGKTDPRAR